MRRPRVLVPHSHAPVDALAHDVGVTCMAIGFVEHVQNYVQQRHVWLGPPVHATGCVEIKQSNCVIGVLADSMKPCNHSIARLILVDPPIVEVFSEADWWL